jgi:hypothetical protein
VVKEVCAIRSLAKSTDRTVSFHLIYYKAQFCGRSPRERVNHVYLIVVCD